MGDKVHPTMTQHLPSFPIMTLVKIYFYSFSLICQESILLRSIGADLWWGALLLKIKYVHVVCLSWSQRSAEKKKVEKIGSAAPQLNAVTLIHCVWVIQPPHPNVLAYVIFTLLSASPHLPTSYLLFYLLCFDHASFAYARSSHTLSDQDPKEKHAECNVKFLSISYYMYIQFCMSLLYEMHTASGLSIPA